MMVHRTVPTMMVHRTVPTMMVHRTFSLRSCLAALVCGSCLFVVLQVGEVLLGDPGFGHGAADDTKQLIIPAVIPTSFVESRTPSSLNNVSEMGPVLALKTGHCDKLVNMGGNWYCSGFDGNKDLCLDDWLVPAHNSCLVYSFGVGPDISFEESIVHAWGCTVYLHDPYINYTKEYHYPNHVYRHVGIALETHTNTYGTQFTSYKDSLAVNGHEDKDIHYLKIDVEGAEFAILPDLIDSGILQNVFQLHMEIHTFRRKTNNEWLINVQAAYGVLRDLEAVGFRRVRGSVNNLLRLHEYKTGVPSCCSDVLWLNHNKRDEYRDKHKRKE